MNVFFIAAGLLIVAIVILTLIAIERGIAKNYRKFRSDENSLFLIYLFRIFVKFFNYLCVLSCIGYVIFDFYKIVSDLDFNREYSAQEITNLMTEPVYVQYLVYAMWSFLGFCLFSFITLICNIELYLRRLVFGAMEKSGETV